MAINIADGRINVDVAQSSGSGTDLALSAGEGATDELGGNIVFKSYNAEATQATALTVTSLGNVVLGGDKIEFANGETIDNATDGTLLLTANVVSASANVKVGGDNILGSDDVSAITLSNGANVQLNNDATVIGSLVVGANLTVNGTTTTVNSNVVTVDDPIMTLGGDSAPESNDSKDRGIEFRYHDGSEAQIGFMGWDDSLSGFALYNAASNSSEVFDGTKSDLTVGKLLIDGNAHHLDVASNALVLTSAGDLTVDANANIELNADGGLVEMKDASDTLYSFSTGVIAGQASTNMAIDSSANVSLEADGGLIEMKGASDSVLYSFSSGAIAGETDVDMKLDSSANIELDAANGKVVMSDDGNVLYTFTTGVIAGETDVDMKLDSSANIELDAAGGKLVMSDDGNVLYTFTSGVIAGEDATDMKIDSAANINMEVASGGNVQLSADGSALFTFSANTIAAPSAAKLDAGGNIELDAAGGNVIMSADGSSLFTFSANTITAPSDAHLDAGGNIHLDAEGNLIQVTGNILPTTSNVFDLGGTNNRFSNIYTGDLDLTNDRGSWTLIEEEDFISFRNNKTGRRFAMVMEDITDLGNYGPGNDGRM